MSNFNDTVKQYILDSIDLDFYEESADTPQEAAQKVIGFIMAEADYPHNRQRLKTDNAIIADHLWGLPSYFNTAHTNYDIIKLAVKWGSLPEKHTDKQAEKITNNFMQFIAHHLQQIAKGYRVKNLKWV